MTTTKEYVRSVLCFVIRGDQILLIHKLRGLGAGKVNGPGGKIEPGEMPLAAAIREVQEEIGVTPQGLTEMGELWFDFADGYRLHCVVFRADDIVGNLIETEEAIPFWCPLNAIPYEKTWADDPHWLPLLVEGKRFEGRFFFDGERMVEKEVKILS